MSRTRIRTPYMQLVEDRAADEFAAAFGIVLKEAVAEAN